MDESELARRLAQVVAEIAGEEGVVGVLALGSYVAGTMTSSSDIDLIVLHTRTHAGDRRYLRQHRNDLLLDIKYWTLQAATDALCGPDTARFIMGEGGMAVLWEGDGSAAQLAQAVAQAAQAPVLPVGPVERLQLDTFRRELHGPVRAALDDGDLTQAWHLMHGCVDGLIEAHSRLQGVPYLSLGKGLRHLRRHFPALAQQVEHALAQADPETCRTELLQIAHQVLGDLAYEADEFDTGWTT